MITVRTSAGSPLASEAANLESTHETPTSIEVSRLHCLKSLTRLTPPLSPSTRSSSKLFLTCFALSTEDFSAFQICVACVHTSRIGQNPHGLPFESRVLQG